MIIKTVKATIVYVGFLILIIGGICILNKSYAQNATQVSCYASDEILNTNALSTMGFGNSQDFKELIAKSQKGHSIVIVDITKDYDLHGEIIDLPQNCVLHFSGGVLSNGTLKGHHTCIEAPLTTIFRKDIIIDGSWNIDYSYPEWFGAKGDGKTDDRLPIQLSLNSFVNTKLLPHKYLINSYQVLNKKKYGLVIPSHHNLESSGFFDLRNASLVIGSKDVEVGIGVYSYVNIKHVSVLGQHYNSHIGGAPGVVGSGTIGIGNADYSDWARDLDFEKVVCQAFDTGYKLMSFGVKFQAVWSRLCNVGFHIYSTKVGGVKNGSAGTTISMINCYADHIYSCGYLIEHEWYSQLLNCSCDRVAEKSSMGNPTTEEIINSCAYKLSNSSNCTMISCGAESTYKVLDITGSNNTILSMQCYPVDPPGMENGALVDLIVIGDSGKTKTQNNYLKNVQVNRTYNKYRCNITASDNEVSKIDNIITTTVKNSTKGEYNDRPSAKEVGEGALYYDSTNKRMIMSNGKKWVNLDGTPL